MSERICADRDGFFTCESRKPFVVHGFNYDHDRSLRLIEEYWSTEWPTVTSDFSEMRDLGANVVRVHFQLGRFMRSADRVEDAALQRFADLLDVAESRGLRLLVTGLAAYRPADSPRWYVELDEAARWQVQARFWSAIASRAAHSPALFGYDLMNEPVVPSEPQAHWVHGAEIDGLHFIQHIARNRDGRAANAIALAWATLQANAIRHADSRALITIGMLPAYAGFDPVDVAPVLDFQSVHLYPESGCDEAAAASLRHARASGPVVVEEFGPIKCSVPELALFMRQNGSLAAGWMGFYWGKTPAELRASRDVADALLLGSLEMFTEDWSARSPEAERETGRR